jgi:cellulose synthase/poly-beta-1,6-N-acetylglucosamine synthase-like glycosyltransferase
VIALVLFWWAVTTVVYTVAGFPAALLLLARLRPRPHREAAIWPQLTVVIAAHDEEAVIADKLRNVLSAAYPAARLQVVVASDGSGDATVARAEAVDDPRVTVLDLPRVGKAAALNAAVAEAHGEVLVFSDANSMLEPRALEHLVRPFADPEVGGVAGNQVYARGGASAAGERAHWGLDRRLKLAQSRLGSAVSATGSLYAIRAALFEPVEEGVTDDFFTSTGVIVRGHRLVFAPDAVAVEPVAADDTREFARKQRVMARGFRAVRSRRVLLDPRRHGGYAVQLFTYKVLRRLLVVPLAVLALTAPRLWRRGPLYRAATAVQGTFWAAAALGTVLRRRPVGQRPWFSVPAFVAAGMVASVRAAATAIGGRRITTWDTHREPGEGS